MVTILMVGFIVIVAAACALMQYAAGSLWWRGNFRPLLYIVLGVALLALAITVLGRGVVFDCSGPPPEDPSPFC
jgi:membrane-associated PAP2 superfamily phosphatase